MVGSVRAAMLLVAIGCSGGATRPVQRPYMTDVCVRPPADDPTREVLYGVVVEQNGRPIGGARIEAVRADRDEAWWLSLESFQTATAANGSYALALPAGPYLARVTAGSHELLWVDLVARAHGMHRLDARIDRALPPGITDVIAVGRERIAIASDCEWTCSTEEAPPPGWWRGAIACPAGTRLTYDRAQSRAAIEVSCQTPDGVRHGPYTAYAAGDPSKRGAVATSGWYERGKECGARRIGDAVGDPADGAPSSSTDR
jgi:carboxypeptidase family protein